MENNFSLEQKSDLMKISEFFKNQMCLNMKADFRTCYERIPHEYLEATGNGFWANINFDEQKKLYEQISQSTFNEIWMFCKSTYPKSGLELKSICAVADGKYYDYLTDLGKTNPRIAEYAKRINSSGDFGYGDFRYREIIDHKKYFYLNDPNIQLIMAIHYLSLSDQENRNEKWTAE